MGMGGARENGQDRLDTWEAPTPIRRPERRIHRQSVGSFPLEPDFDVFDEGNHILIVGDMPGVNKEDIKYEVKDNVLKIWTENGRKYQKEIELPASVTKKVGLNYRNGVLEVKLTKEKENK